jgi:hypothetical protein
MQVPIPDLVLDTNVYLEQIDFQDLARQTTNAGTDKSALETKEVKHRRHRAKYSILLAWFCHLRGLSTAFVWDETLKLLLRGRVDPKRPRDVSTVVTMLNIRLVHELTLTRWVRGRIEPIESECAGTDIDNIILDYAAKVAVPLLTNEGNTIAGPVDTNAKRMPNLRGKAKQRGVAVFTPKEYLLGQGFDIASEARKFYDAFIAEISNLEVLDLAEQPIATRALERLIDLYRFILHAP